MTIASEIAKLISNLADCYTACTNKGATIPQDENFDNLATCIGSIPAGGSNGKFLVQVIDYDGTILKQDHLDTSDTFTLPTPPTHSGLTFQSWSSPVNIVDNTITVTNSDITIGATYTTASGLSEFDITLTTVTGLNVTLNMDGTKDWGDGTTDTSTTHTYASIGDYTITCNGSTMTTSNTSGLFGQMNSSSNANYYVKDIRLGSSLTSIGDYAFTTCYSLTSITIPSSITSIGTYSFYNCYSLISITIPEGVTSIGAYVFRYCQSLTSATIPSDVASIGDYAFGNCASLASVTIPSNVTSIGAYVFFNCYSLKSITIPSNVTSISDYAFGNCYSLKSITIPSSLTSIGDGAFSNCYSLTSITIPSSGASLGNQSFRNCYSILEYDFSSFTAVPTINNSNVFGNINKTCKIKVPAALESQWKTTTNWVYYANYIIGV